MACFYCRRKRAVHQPLVVEDCWTTKKARLVGYTKRGVYQPRIGDETVQKEAVEAGPKEAVLDVVLQADPVLDVALQADPVMDVALQADPVLDVNGKLKLLM